MARGFNLTAQINLQGPSNIRTVVANIRRQIGTISSNVNLNIDPASVRTVAGLNSSLNQLNATLRTTASSATNVAQAMRDMMNAMRGVAAVRMPNHAGQISSALQGVQASARGAQSAVAGSRTEIEEFGNQAGLAVRRFAAFSSSTVLIYGLVGAIKSGISEFISFDRQITRISQVTGESKENLGKLQGTISSLSGQLGVAAKDLATVAVTLSQAGLTARDTETALNALALSALTPSFDNMNQTVEGSIALMRQFKISANDLEGALGSINAVSAKFAVESSDIIAAIQRTGGVFAAASRGVSEGTDALNEFIAVFTSVRATTRESAETIATGLRTIFTRIQRGDTIEALKEYGVNLTDLDGKFVGAYRAVQLLSEGLSRIDSRDLKFSNIVEELGGFRQIGKVIPLIQEFATAQDALKVAQAGQGSLATDAAKGQLALAVQISKTREEFLTLIRSVGNTDSFQKMVTVGLSLASAFIKVADAAKELLPIITLFAAVKGASAITQFASGFGRGFTGGGRRNNTPGFASGGLVPGQGDSDSVPARLTPGEFVIRKSAVKAIGSNNLHRLNRANGGRIQKFSNGGLTQSYTVDQLLTRDGSATISKALGKTNIEAVGDSAKIRIVPRVLKLQNADFKKIWDMASEKASTSKKYRSYAGVDVSGENREKLERTIQFSKSQKNRKRAVSDKETEVGKLGSAENRWGKAYESLIISKLKQGWESASTKSNYPVDLLQIGKNQAIQKIGEAKFKTSNTEDIDLVSKMLRYRIDKKQVGFAGSKNGLFKENDKKDTDPNIFLGDLDYFWAADQKDKFYSWVQTQQKNKVPGFNLGGSVRKFVDAGIVTPTSGKTASSSEIFRVLTANDAVRLTGISIGEIQKILKKRNTLSSSEKAIKDKILAEYTKKSSGIRTANNLDIEKATTEGLLFGAAGFKGRAFPTTDRMDIPGLKNPVKVRITSGVLDKEAAGRDIKRMTQAMSGVSAKSTKNIQIRDLLKQVGPIYSDFDRTLAFGADKILSDPNTPRFSEFADRNKVSDALNKATLSKLGRALVDQVRKTPEFLNNLHVISARPQSTMDLIGAWLAKNKLPIPASRIKGVGGPDRTAEQIAKFKLQEMDTSGSFIDDDKRNVDIAKAAGMNTYLYKDKKVKASDRKKMGEANAQGYMAESIIHQLGGPIGNKAATNYGIDFPDGLQDAAKYFKLPPNIPTDAKLTLNGPAELKGQIGNYLKARGYADGGLVPGVGSQDTVPANLNVGDFVIRKKAVQTIGANKLSSLNRKAAGGSINTTVPALLTPGEFVINRKTASKIGTPTLNRLNHADKVSRFNSGGLVGGVQEFATGGAVQRLFFGGRAGPAARPNTVNTETIGVSGNTAQRLSELAEVLSELGVASSRSGQLLRRGYQATAAEAERAYNADILMARAAGASATVLYDLQRALQQSQQEARNEVRIRQQLGNVNGRQIQEALSMVDEELERLTVTARAAATAAGTLTDEEVEAEVRAGAGARRTQAFENVNASGVLTGVGGGVDLAGIGATGDDLERTMMALMRDADTLEQMNQEYIRQRRQAMAEEARLSGDTARAARIRAGLERDVEQVISAEVRARRQAVEEAARSAGSRDTGTRDRNGGNRGLLMAGGIITIGSLIGQQMDTKSSAGQAAGAAGLQTASQSAGVAIGVISQLGDFEQHLRDAGTAAGDMGANAVAAARRLLTIGSVIFTTVSVIKDMTNAMNEFKLEVEAKKLEFAMKGVEQEFEILRKDVKALDFTRLNNKLEAASTAFANQINLLSTRTLYTFTNLLDALDTFTGNGVGGEEGLRQRSDIQRLGGNRAYYRASNSVEDTSVEFNKIIPQLAQEQAAMGRALADSLLESFRERAKRGESVSDITSDPNFERFSESLANADVVIRQKILEVENSGLGAAETNRIKENIIKNAGEEKARQQVNIVLREKEAQALQRSTYVFTGSLNRMFKNMEQAISATSSSLDSMQKSIDANISSLTGSASLQNINSQTSNIISNPRAYSQASVSQAQSTGAGFFGQSSALVKSLLKVGETAENVIMKTINDTVQQNPEANDEIIGSKITTNINKALKDLGLPPEFVDKLSGQIGKAIADLRKSGDDKISFGDLQEKVSGLSSALDTAKNVSDIVVKALDNFNNSLNTYSSNINKIIDLEISSREKLRRAEDILINSGLELAKTFGESINLEQSRARAQAKTSKLTGGPTDPNGIFNQILKLNTEKSIAESSRAQAGERGAAGADDFTKFSKDVQNNSVALRESYNALRLLADNSDSASEAMQKIQDVQQRNAGKVSFIEKLATSTPEEAASLGNALSRLQKNINGQINTINNSVGAQKAYFEALQSGASGFEAMKAAQTAFANERKETLSALQDIMPFLGDNKQASNIRANALESMLKESGMGISPMMMDVLNNLRNPQADPAIAAAMSYYNEAIVIQNQANNYLAKIDQHLAQDTAEANAQALAKALKDVTLTFFNAELKDIAANINNLVPVRPQARAAGGVIYAAGGQMVNFQPKGTDTVPAMLTPGEFVVNKQATASNRSLLESINSNKYSSGGSVRYYDRGGFVHDAGDPADFTKSASVSQVKVLNLSQPSVINDLLKAEGDLYQTPSVYTFLNSNKQTPQPTRDDYNLSELEPDNGTVVPGMGPIIRRKNKKEADYQRDPRENALLNSSVARKSVNSKEFFHVNGLDKDSFDTTTIKELELEEYTRKALDNNINWALNNVGMPSNEYGPLPKISDFTINNPDIFSSNIVSKPYGIIVPDTAGGMPNLESATSRMYQIHEATTAGGVKENAISKDPPFFQAPVGAAPGSSKAGLDFKPKESIVGKNLVMNNLNKNIIPYNKIAELNTKSNEAFNKYKATADFLNNPQFKDDDASIPDGVLEIQEKLSKIYQGNSIGEIIPGNGLIKKYFPRIQGIENAGSLMILQDSATEAINKSIAEYAANPIAARAKNIVFSGKNLNMVGDFVKDVPIDIFSLDKTGAMDLPPKSFPYIVNGSLEDLDPTLRKKMEEQLTAKNPGQISMKRLQPETLSIPVNDLLGAVNVQQKVKDTLRLNGQNLDLKVAYDEWEGQLFDPVTNKFQKNKSRYFLPAQNDKTFFESLDSSKRRLTSDPIMGAKYSAQQLLQSIGDGSNVGNVAQNLEDYIKSVVNKTPDTGERKKLSDSLNSQFKGSFIKSQDMTFPGVDTLTTFNNDPVTFNIGKHILETLDATRIQATEGADKTEGKPLGNQGVDEKDLPQAVRSAAKGALSIFGRAQVPGLSNSWLSRYIGKIPNMVNLKPSGAKNMAGYASTVMEQFGAYLSNIGTQSNNPNQYQGLKELWTLASGASQVFSGLASGDSSLFGQFASNNLKLVDLFRTLGGGTLMRRLTGLELNGDWKNLLANTAKGKNRKVGINSLGNQQDLTEDNLPNTLQGLIDLVFNPYAEFDDLDTRSVLMTKLVNDLSNFKEGNGVPYFDRNTMDFISKNVQSLNKWYHGDGNWLGQDFLFDKRTKPEDRIPAFFASASDISFPDIYKEANYAQVSLGLGNKFGRLPSPNWFKTRTAQGLQTGGIVYAANGGQMVQFQPRGTDTVPAMLTPGEFVINRKATQENLPLLKAINEGGAKALSKGGVIYAQYGGMTDENGGGPANDREAYLEAERQANRTKVQQKEAQFKKLQQYQKNMGLFEQSLQEDINNLVSGKSSPEMDEDTKFLTSKKLTSYYETIKNRNKEILFVSGGDGLLGTEDDILQEKEMSLDDLSLKYSTLGLIPGVGLPFDVAAAVVDVMRGDLTGAGLSLAGSVEGIGQATGIAKIATLAKTATAAKTASMAAGGLGLFAMFKKFKPYQPDEVIKQLDEAVETYRQANLTFDAATGLSRASDDIAMDLSVAEKIKDRLRYGGADLSDAASIERTFDPAILQKIGKGGLTQDFLKITDDIKKLVLQGKLDDATDIAGKIPKAPGISTKTKAIATLLATGLGYGGLQAYRSSNIAAEARTKGDPEEVMAATRDLTGRDPLARENLSGSQVSAKKPGAPAPALVPEEKSPLQTKQEEEIQRKINAIDAIKREFNLVRLSQKTRDALDKEENLTKRLSEYTSKAMLMRANPLKNYNKGGMIYASEGKLINFQPRGTDTVPAMLTPGEFVVNAKATRNNLDLLKSINSGGDSKGYSSGGVVYLAEGGSFNNGSGSLSTSSKQLIENARQTLRKVTNSQFKVENLAELKKEGQRRKNEGIVASTVRGKDGEVKVVTQKSDEQAKKEREQKEQEKEQQKKVDDKKYDLKLNVDARENYLKQIQENLPKQKAALDAAAEFRKELQAVKLQFIQETEEKIKTTASDLGITILELLNNSPEAKAEYDFVKGRASVGDLSQSGHQKLIDALSKLGGDLSSKLKYGDELNNIKDLVAVSPEDIAGIEMPNKIREIYYNEVGAKEIYQRNATITQGILSDDFKYKNDEVVGPLSLKPEYRTSGGMIYASTGKLIPYEPKGTDTVPAMLTPGEFVVNRSATQKNLPLLKAINSGKTQGYSNGGVVYLAFGGNADGDRQQRKDDYDKEMQDRRDNRQNAIMERGLANSPNGALIMQIKKQAEDSSQLFEALNSEAINEGLTAQGLAERYWKVWGPLEKENPSELVRNAKIQYEVDQKRFNYLKEIYTNSSQAYAALKGDAKARNIFVQGKNGAKSLIEILAGQEVAKKEGTAIDEGWKFLFKTYTVLNGANQAGGSAAGTTVAGEEKPVAKQYGGMIYANHGMMIPYIPRGSDTVPAMLTPGEFVVNKASAQQNLPLLQAINNNRYNRGGSVKYLANGGMTDESGAGGGVSNGGGSSSPNMDGLSQFTTKFAEFIGQLKAINLPPVINVTGNHKVEVVINGASVFEKLEPSVSALVVSEVNKAMGTLSDQTEGALGRK
jgi:TP901 family phage tail tape measure protein